MYFQWGGGIRGWDSGIEGDANDDGEAVEGGLRFCSKAFAFRLMALDPRALGKAVVEMREEKRKS